MTEESNGTFIGIVSNKDAPPREIVVSASNRRQAAQKILKIFWKEKLGNAKELLVIPDPGEEVEYEPDMSCLDVMYNYLPADVVDRVIRESDGVIGKDSKYPNSRCQLVRLEKKDYRNLPGGSKKGKEQPKELPTFKKLPPPPPVDVWKQSRIQNVPTPPTRVTKSVFHSKDGDSRSKMLHIPLRDMAVRTQA